MTELEMEELLWAYPEKLLDEALTRFERQPSSAVGRADLVFEDSLRRLLVVEIKKGSLGRDAVPQLLDYLGMMKHRFPGRAVRLAIVANSIPEERRLSCEALGIEGHELSEERFRQLAAEVGYSFRSEGLSQGRTPATPRDQTPAGKRPAPGSGTSSDKGRRVWDSSVVVSIVEECARLLSSVERTVGFVPLATRGGRRYLVLGRYGRPLSPKAEGTAKPQRVRLEARSSKGVAYLKISVLALNRKASWSERLIAAGVLPFRREDEQRRDYLAFPLYSSEDAVRIAGLLTEMFSDSLHSG